MFNFIHICVTAGDSEVPVPKARSRISKQQKDALSGEPSASSIHQRVNPDLYLCRDRETTALSPSQNQKKITKL